MAYPHLLRIFCRALCGLTLGIAPGIGLFWMGWGQQAVGLMLIGGTLGALLAFARPVWGISPFQAVLSGALYYLQGVASNAIPYGDRFVPHWRDNLPKETPNEEILDSDDDIDSEIRRIKFGAAIGALLGFIPAIVTAIRFEPGTDPNEKLPAWVNYLVILIGIGILSMMVLGSIGAIAAALTCAGSHRRGFGIGIIAGILIGTGLAVAIGPVQDGSPWRMYYFGWALFGWMGALFGTLASHRESTPTPHNRLETGSELPESE